MVLYLLFELVCKVMKINCVSIHSPIHCSIFKDREDIEVFRAAIDSADL